MLQGDNSEGSSQQAEGEDGPAVDRHHCMQAGYYPVDRTRWGVLRPGIQPGMTTWAGQGFQCRDHGMLAFRQQLTLPLRCAWQVGTQKPRSQRQGE